MAIVNRQSLIVNQRTYVLGVDGGNTKTIALVARLDGTVIGAGRAGCGDIYRIPPDVPGMPEVEQAVQQALAQAGITAALVQVLACSMAGADWPEDFAFIANALDAYGFGGTRVVVNDALGALRAGSPDGTGVAVVCGTGAATGARSPDGRVWHSSFWQTVEGSAQLGMQTLAAVYQAELGILPPTSLTGRVLRFFEADSVAAVLHRFSARHATPPAHVRHLAHALLDEASTGDAVAQQIVQAHGAGLGHYALAAARQVGIDHTPFTLVLAGGVLRHASPLLSEAIAARVRTDSPQVQVVASRFEPAVGALLLALEAAGVAVDAPLLARLAASLPPASLFETLLLT